VSQKKYKTWYRHGISLVETMNAIAILSIAVIGITGYRYCAALDTHKSDACIASARIGQLLSESWRGMQGSENYDPVSHLGAGLTISESDGPEAPMGYTVLGSYEILMNDMAFYTTLSWKDPSSNLRILNIVLIWARQNRGQNNIDESERTFRLTTYVLK
jgi:hypothetical protein